MRGSKNRTLDPLLRAGIGGSLPQEQAAILTKIAAVLLNEDCRNFLSLHSDRTRVIY